MLASPQRSQWRGRAGFSPASLLSFEQKHQKQTAHSDYALERVCVKCGQKWSAGCSKPGVQLEKNECREFLNYCHPRSAAKMLNSQLDLNRGMGDLRLFVSCQKADPPRTSRARDEGLRVYGQPGVKGPYSNTRIGIALLHGHRSRLRIESHFNRHIRLLRCRRVFPLLHRVTSNFG